MVLASTNQNQRKETRRTKRYQEHLGSKEKTTKKTTEGNNMEKRKKYLKEKAIKEETCEHPIESGPYQAPTQLT